jgi:hypothetical protein
MFEIFEKEGFLVTTEVNPGRKRSVIDVAVTFGNISQQIEMEEETLERMSVPSASVRTMDFFVTMLSERFV